MMGKGCCVEAVSGELAAGDVVGVQCSTAVVAEDGVVVDPAAEDGGGDALKRGQRRVNGVDAETREFDSSV